MAADTDLLMEELRYEYEEEQRGVMEDEARDAFMQDEYWQSVAMDLNMTMESLWSREKREFCDTYFE